MIPLDDFFLDPLAEGLLNDRKSYIHKPLTRELAQLLGLRGHVVPVVRVFGEPIENFFNT